jgi:uncharacterized protein
MTQLDEKLAALRGILAGIRSALVAYSGGVDSAFLLWTALDVLGPEQVLAATCSSPIFSQRELDAAEEIARQMGVPHRFIPTYQMQDPQFVLNPPHRCYLCKREMLSRLAEVAREKRLACVIEGSNLDDRDEYRPGTQAVREAGVCSPLKEARLTKTEIRSLSRHAGLPTWSNPAQTCLATRFPYDSHITLDGLARVEAGEALLQKMGFGQLRVRDHTPIARIEVATEEVPRLAHPEEAARVVAEFKKIGYLYVTLDLEGYRRGSLDLSLSAGLHPALL